MSIPELAALARKHWEKYLPQKVKALRKEGKLNEALQGAAKLAQAEIDHLMRYRHYQEHEAREVALPLFILLKPEPEDEDDEQAQELREKEAEYQRNPPPEVAADREREREETDQRNNPVTRIARATGVEPAKVAEVVQLTLEELHRITIIDERGPTAAVMEACFSFGDKTAFHLIGLYVSEYDYHGRDDEAGIWVEVAKRFIPDAYREGCQRIAPWFAAKTADRLALDTDMKLSKWRRRSGAGHPNP